MKTASPRDLFFDQLRDLHSVETQLMASLPTVEARAEWPLLAALIGRHAEETKRHAAIITFILNAHNVEKGDDTCKAMEGLIQGGDSHLDGVDVPETRDLMIVAHCLRIEHYEIAGYGITLRLAEQLGYGDEAALLRSVLEEERATAAQLEELQPVLFERALPMVTL